MEEFNHLPTKKHILTYGVINGLIAVAFGVILYTQGMHLSQEKTITFIPYFISVAVIIYGIIQYKKDNQGYLTLNSALKLGAGIAAVGSLIGMIWFMVLTNVLEPDFWTLVSEAAKEKAFADNPQMTEEMWEQGMEMQAKFRPFILPIGILCNAIIGLIIGLVVGVIAKKEPEL